MTDPDGILRRLTTVFREIFDNPQLEIDHSTSAKDLSGWDSFAHINLIVAIEEMFGVRFTTREIGAFTCVGDVVDLLAQKRA